MFERLIGAKSRPGRKSARLTAHVDTKREENHSGCAGNAEFSSRREEEEEERSRPRMEFCAGRRLPIPRNLLLLIRET